jgi:hypothetical protein
MYLHYWFFGLLWKIWSVKSLEKTHRNHFGLNRFGRGKNRTEPKLIGLNRFSVRFGSKTKKKTNSVWLFILVQNRTEPKMLSPMHTSSLKRATSSMVEHIHLLPFHERNKLNDDIHDKAITIARSEIPG